MKPADIKSSNEDPKFKIANIGRYQNIKIFLQKVALQIVPKKFL